MIELRAHCCETYHKASVFRTLLYHKHGGLQYTYPPTCVCQACIALANDADERERQAASPLSLLAGLGGSEPPRAFVVQGLHEVVGEHLDVIDVM